MITETPTTMPAKIILAERWLDDAIYPLPGGDNDYTDSAAALWAGFRIEQAQHEEQASQHATATMGYEFPGVAEILSDESTARDIIYTAEYDRLEASARQRRILALAAIIPDTFEYGVNDLVRSVRQVGWK